MGFWKLLMGSYPKPPTYLKDRRNLLSRMEVVCRCGILLMRQEFLLKTSRLECPKFDGNDFREWWTKLEQYFEVEGIPEVNKVRIVMLNLEGRALELHHFYSQRNGGLQMLSWLAYIKSLQNRFGYGPFGDPMRELVNLKQQGSIFCLKSNNVGVVANTLHYGALNMSIGATTIVSSGTGCLDTGQFMY
ncbi:hypothetical protein V6Z11_D13G164100 [Gossypium hirsutum]